MSIFHRLTVLPIAALVSFGVHAEQAPTPAAQAEPRVRMQNKIGRRNDPNTNSFPGAPNSVNKLLNNPSFNSRNSEGTQQVPWR
jgi:hypothetical protein